MPVRAALVLFAGAVACLALALVGARMNGPALIDMLRQRAEAARDAAGGAGIVITFIEGHGWLTRHPVLSGGKGLDKDTRARAAQAIAAVPGVGGVNWAGSRKRGDALAEPTGATPLHCQDEVEGILKTRTIRFSEASARIDPASEKLLDEVADALRPCVGSIIAITGHTDGNGNEAANIALSMARADAVRFELIGRGIPADGLRSTGIGSKHPVAGLDPRDPANRRIEFSVIASMPVKPTPIDTPGAG
ncbi:OmpA family protein [Novosphingobium album (ex Liu et al. 2023)]|uniref:OmpA family protein n=1 Tax=Novosphingobium album (ex Liu et al. 2023) TaxID=3031130 RepID=A0ABT5WN72_9SPHN|nr:OmpA family protein [Novosphingobium album (ex Liu et al. 2023)]MDE8651176.1 OmpA family protein [Novosphingobium album (ex Liu et al. 2023)]